jgi:hypothetical protein
LTLLELSLDELFILYAAVGLEECAMCVCDVNDTNTITALDGLYAVGPRDPLTVQAVAVTSA